MNKNIICWGLMVFVWAPAAHGNPTFLFDCDLRTEHFGSSFKEINFQVKNSRVDACQLCGNCNGVNILSLRKTNWIDVADVLGSPRLIKSRGKPGGFLNIQKIKADYQPVRERVSESLIQAGAIMIGSALHIAGNMQQNFKKCSKQDI